MTKTETGFRGLQPAADAGKGAAPAKASPRIIPAGRPVPGRPRRSRLALSAGVIGA
jgi:hypothetical protein